MHPQPDKALSDARQQLTPAQMMTMLAELWHVDKNISGKKSTGGDLSMEENGITSLAAFRAQIDELDDELWQLIYRRMQLSEQIGAYKRGHQMSVLQSDRWQQLVHDRLKWAEAHGMKEENVMQILDAIHNESRRRQ